MTRTPIAVVTLVLALVAVAAASSGSPLQSATPAVPCSEIIDVTKWPYIGSRDPRYRYRSVLGVASVPPAYISQVVHLRDGAWPYWSKGRPCRSRRPWTGHGKRALGVAKARNDHVGWQYGNRQFSSDLALRL